MGVTATSNTALIALPDAINVDNANNILANLMNQVDDKQPIVDLSPVMHCDSAGVAVLIEAKVLMKQRDIDIEYVSPSPQLRQLATFLKVEQLLF